MSNFLEDIFGGATEVYIAISTSNKLELGVLDSHTNLMKSYAVASIEYNEAAREITDYDIFRAKIEKMFEECNLQPSKCNVHISLPLVWFGYKDNIPITSNDENIKNIVFSELDQTYIFKRTDPVPYWFDAPISLDTDTKSIFYTAIQSDAIETLRNIFKEMGSNLIEITSSFTSDLKGLLNYGLAEDEMISDKVWSLMIISNSGFQLFGFQGKKLTDFYEEPLPIKSLEQDEIYSTIDNAAQIALMSSAAQSLVMISETDSVSAQALAKKIQFNGKVTVIEDNTFRKKPLSDVTRALIPEYQPDVSLHLLGMFPDPAIFPIVINFLTCVEGYTRDDIIEIPISNDHIIVLTKPKAMLYSVILLLALALPLGLAAGGTYFLNQKFTSHVEELDSEIADVTAQLKKIENAHSGTEFNPYKEIEKVLKFNRTKIMAYAAIGDSIPQNVYLSYFMTGDNGYIDIQGFANSVEDVYVFFQNLKDTLAESKLRLSKLDMKTSSLEDVIENSSNVSTAPYVFEITNMNDGQLSSFMNALRGSSNDSPNQDKQNSENKGN